MPVIGTNVPVVELENGDTVSMTLFAVMNVADPLAAVRWMVKAGHTLAFSQNEILRANIKERETPTL